VPFIAFIPTQFVGASGVLAVVVAGLYSGHHGARRFSAQARVAERLNWRTLQFVLENGVFLLMGVQISGLISSVIQDDLSAGLAVVLGVLMTAVVIVIRFLFVGPVLLLLRAELRRAERAQTRFGEFLDQFRRRSDVSARGVRRQQRAEAIHERRGQDLAQLQAEGLGWRGGVILGWSGMRGVVTLAAAQSLPDTTPYRPQLVLIAFTVAVVTLLLQGGTLPWLIRLTGIRGADAVADSRELAGLLDELAESGLAAIESPSLELPEGQMIDEHVLERVRSDTLLRAQSAWERVERTPTSPVSPQRQYRALRREVLRAEREALLEARSAGRYPSRILIRAQAMLDLEETRLEQIDNPGGA
jgi:CPA1 family monovalent cation:H+ antiporter